MIALTHSEACDRVAAAVNMFDAYQTATASLIRYSNAYVIPFITAFNYFNQVESFRFWQRPPAENLSAYLRLGTMNLELAGHAYEGDMQAMDHFLAMELKPLLAALSMDQTNDLIEYSKRMQRLSKLVAYIYPEAIDGIGSEFGFHFEHQPASSCVDETDRFFLYQVMPTDPKIEIRTNGKPILIIPPFVLGANILAFLPLEKRSYAHAFANSGFPTYIRIAKDIQTTEAVQTMTPEDDARDTKRFCQKIKTRHGLPVTLNGYCQGGYTALCNLLSGELDDIVDALLTCVSPMDGSRGKGLTRFLKKLPIVFNDLAYGTKTLPNGNKVADGTLMGWVYKIKSIETESPMLSMWRDMMILAKSNGAQLSINKTALALNHWLIRDRNDLALNMTRVSFDAYNIPISKDGTLPIKLFGRSLNLKRIQERKIPWLICYGKQDDLVDPETALAPTDFIKAEVTGFPKGHVAIATSWSNPESAYALHLRYQDEGTRGPVRFQMDLQEEIDRSEAKKMPKADKQLKTGSAASPQQVKDAGVKTAKASTKNKQSTSDPSPKKLRAKSTAPGKKSEKAKPEKIIKNARADMTQKGNK